MNIIGIIEVTIYVDTKVTVKVVKNEIRTYIVCGEDSEKGKKEKRIRYIDLKLI